MSIHNLRPGSKAVKKDLPQHRKRERSQDLIDFAPGARRLADLVSVKFVLAVVNATAPAVLEAVRAELILADALQDRRRSTALLRGVDGLTRLRLALRGEEVTP